MVTRYESSERRLKFCSVAGTHCDGDGARRRRFWPGAFVLLVGEVIDRLLDDGEALVGVVCPRPRFPVLVLVALPLS